MIEALTYLAALTLFSFVLAGTALLRHEMLLLLSIPPVFAALIIGFVMAVYAQENFGGLPVGAALLVAVLPAWWLSQRLAARDLLIAIYLAWALGMLLALLGFSFPDPD